MQTQIQQPKNNGKRTRISLRAIVIVIVVVLAFIVWKYWTPITTILWLRWTMIAFLVSATVMFSIFWIRGSSDATRRFRITTVVLGVIAIVTLIWVLATLHLIQDKTISDNISNSMLVLFTSAMVTLPFLQLMQSSGTSSSPPSSQSTISPAPSHTTSHGAIPGTATTPQAGAIGPVIQPSTHGTQASQSTPIHFFISYTDADRDVSVWINQVLQNAHYKTFLPERDIRRGTNYVQQINLALATAERTLLILSPDYPLDVITDWTVAFHKDRGGWKGLLIPVYIKAYPSEQLEGVLGPIWPINLINKNEDEAQRLLLEGVDPGGKGPTPPVQFPGTL